jgi:hypothetical protein
LPQNLTSLLHLPSLLHLTSVLHLTSLLHLTWLLHLPSLLQAILQDLYCSQEASGYLRHHVVLGLPEDASVVLLMPLLPALLHESVGELQLASRWVREMKPTIQVRHFRSIPNDISDTGSSES